MGISSFWSVSWSGFWVQTICNFLQQFLVFRINKVYSLVCTIAKPCSRRVCECSELYLLWLHLAGFDFFCSENVYTLDLPSFWKYCTYPCLTLSIIMSCTEILDNPLFNKHDWFSMISSMYFTVDWLLMEQWHQSTPMKISFSMKWPNTDQIRDQLSSQRHTNSQLASTSSVNPRSFTHDVFCIFYDMNVEGWNLIYMPL